ncbi:MAG: DUF1566 domain-containing protein, partial [Desulfosudaceae bacterium]
MKTRPGSGLLVVIVVLFTGVVMSFAGPFPIPDTGQTECYDADGNILDPCPAPGDLFYGQDACYTINPPSYTKLDTSGNELDDSATDWAMVKDNVTGLIWEVKTDDGGMHDKDDKYDYDDATAFIVQLNTDQFGGFTDWRLPTRLELTGLVDYSQHWPTINTVFFPYTTYDYYWSSFLYADSATGAWAVEFLNGYESICNKTDSYRVRAVRGDQPEVSGHLVINGDDTVSDENTGLMWMQFTADNNDDDIIDDNDKMNWQEALDWCEGLTLAGYSDWRLPTIKELQSIVDIQTSEPAIDTNFFPDTGSNSAYWSST